MTMDDSELKLQFSLTGTKRYTYKWQYHRDNGPAITYTSGEEYWYQHGKIHRADGPAVINCHGTKEWWLNGKRYDPIEWMLKVHEMDQHG